MGDKALVVVEVRGGVVQNTTAPDGVDVWVVDYDNLEEVTCPNCGAVDDYYPDYSAMDWFICNGCNKPFQNEEQTNG